MFQKKLQIEIDHNKLNIGQRNKMNISKRYRGFNRIYQLNLSKYLNDQHQNRSKMISNDPKHYNQQQSGKIIIKSNNPKILIKQISQQAEFQNKIFYKRKFIYQFQPREKIQKNLSMKTWQKLAVNRPSVQHLKKLTDNNNNTQQKGQNKKAGLSSIYKQKILKNKLQQQKAESEQGQISKDFRPLCIKSQKKKIVQGKSKQQKTSYNNCNIKNRRNHYSGYEKYGNVKSQINYEKKINQFSSFYDQISTFQYEKDKKPTSKASLLPKINKQKQIANKRQKKFPILSKNPTQLKNIRTQSFIIVQMQSEDIIVGQKAFNKYQIASLTKIMTFYTVVQTIKKFKLKIQNEEVKVTDLVYATGGTTAQIQAGQIYTVQQMLFGLILPSGNDAAIALANWGGQYYTQNSSQESNIKAFVNQMNKTAKMLGLIQTKFGNPHGLPDFQTRSTAFQVAKLCSICLKQEVFKKVVSTKFYKCEVKNQKGQKKINQWTNTHKLLRREGFIGIKTGITVTAGPCLASAYIFREKTYICILLRATKVSRRFKQTRRLLVWALQKLYQTDLSQKQVQILKNLKKNRHQIDSDYSQDEPQFQYENLGFNQYKKRCNIIGDM